MGRGRLLAIASIAAALAGLSNGYEQPKSRALTITKRDSNQKVKTKKGNKPKKSNYTSKMKVKPNTVRKDFNQRRR